MRPKERRETGEHDLFRSRLDQIIDLDHALVKLAKAIDWRFLEDKFGAAYSGQAGASTAADAADGRARHPQAQLRSVRRGAV